jgi:hypothetical protein
MITLNQVADTFIHDYAGGIMSKDDKIKLDRRDIILKVRSYLVPILKTEIFGKWNEGDRSAIASVIASYELSLLTEDTGQKYLSIPDFYMTLPRNMGVHRMYVKGNPLGIDFIFMANPGITGRLPHTKMKNTQYVYIEGRKLYLGAGDIAKKGDKLVLQLIVPAPDTIAAGDPLPILGEHVDQIMTMLKRDYSPVAAIPPDLLNNQNPSIR